jgi:polysaccharide deacetylase family protein (PEP-CTERM system associated)
MNILSFDLEDWYQLVHRRITGELIPTRDTIFRQTDLLLELLEQARTRATFFVLGMVAERYPHLVRRIAAQGHEIACHGYAHVRVSDVSPREFESDTRRAVSNLEDIVAAPVLGYRAPEFSISARTFWALNVLAECGFRYDSSIFPIHHPRYGIPGFAAHPATVRLPGGSQIVELPLAALPLAGMRLPVAGGGYFRALPLWLLRRAAFDCEARRLPMVTYFHPYEFDTAPLDVFQILPRNGWKRRLAGTRLNWAQNLGRAGVRRKLAALLEQFHFTTCKDYLDAVRLSQNAEVLRAASASV